ncbi:MAG: dTDP-4-dehydrorhamnose reductase [Sedimentisphaerales bacterium]|nr:dTDP-4-dehydrorhamnose reductase [Sedimentisphaerales bacterium]
MSDKDMVIVGGRGMLGTDLITACLSVGIKPMVYDLPEFDICRCDHLEQAIVTGSIVVNCAAYTNVEKAESEPELAEKVNAEAVDMLGHVARTRNAYVIHISTDFVFDGLQDHPYVETDLPNPVSVYGTSKFHGEQALAHSGARHCIIRVQWTYGHGGTNFVKKILELAQSRDRLKVIDDQVGSPTATTEVAGVLVEILSMQEKPTGLFHLAASGYTSRYDMARFVLAAKGLRTLLEPCKTSDFPTAARRPLNSRFDCSKIQALLGRNLTHWEEPLKHFMEEL